ncbi:hypothetical protein AO1008_04347 [Aspergillus oryzae 100-8]|uniref:Uncharacterized protein n=1 Tax=Aspergillus oryzae (strain 3.042) TaxID=1160506 RepID=I7ZS81_ASPO3|nr:hypothetical protein Ao3042_08609 [Aspergillus oryzae 3.042]KDE85969.1 hypothetical protein AO1008_04347 [Aspergillus oryzae 100-8]|eukprot:EIT74762.1 hypothetical protein Ao3042_08609 [Aspergillus oryzae 3.042]
MDQIQLRIETPAPHDFEAPIQTIINAAIQSTNPSPAKDAALTLDAVYLDYITSPNKDPESVLTLFWELINSFASQIPYESPAQEKLVNIVQELADITAEQTILNQKLWRNLPYFSSEFPQTWEGTLFFYYCPTMVNADDKEKKRRFVNLQAYAARILGLGLSSLETYAIWALSDVAEGVMIPVRAIGGTQGGPLWMLPKAERRKLRRKFRGTQGLCLDRWLLWKQQFAAIRDCGSVDTETRRIAKNVVETMDRVDGHS